MAASDSGNYTVIITNTYGSVTSSPATFLVIPPLIASQPVSVKAVPGESVSFSVSVNGQPPFTYQWQFNGTNIAGATARIYTLASAQPTNSGAYRVLVTNPYATETSSTATLVDSLYPSMELSKAAPAVAGQLSIDGAPGYRYVIEATTNLVNWVPVYTNISPFTFTDSDRLPDRYYRSQYTP